MEPTSKDIADALTSLSAHHEQDERLSRLIVDCMKGDHDDEAELLEAAENIAKENEQLAEELAALRKAYFAVQSEAATLPAWRGIAVVGWALALVEFLSLVSWGVK